MKYYLLRSLSWHQIILLGDGGNVCVNNLLLVTLDSAERSE